MTTAQLKLKPGKLLWMQRVPQATWLPTIRYPVAYVGPAKPLLSSGEFGRHRVRLVIPGNQSVSTVDGCWLQPRKSGEIRRTFPIGFRKDRVIKIDDPQPVDWIYGRIRRCTVCNKPMEPTESGHWSTCPDFHGGLFQALNDKEFAAWMTTKFPSIETIRNECGQGFVGLRKIVTLSQAIRHLECSIHRTRAGFLVIAWAVTNPEQRIDSCRIQFGLYEIETGMQISAESDPTFKFCLVHPDRSPLVGAKDL